MPADDAGAASSAGDLAAVFEGEPRRAAAANGAGAPELRLGAWEGPLDLLLELARAGKVDLARLPILGLAGQFGAALEAAAAARRVPLSRLGDWLVMAAHLAWLRSRRLLPADAGEGEEARREAEPLHRKLADREFVLRLADWPERRPQLGRDVFARGRAEEGLDAPERTVPRADVAALLHACLAVMERPDPGGAYRPEPLALWRVPDALARLRRMLPAIAEGAPLGRFLPDMTDDGPDAALRRRAALASTLLAGLEMAREGAAALVQDEPFGRVHVAPVASAIGGLGPGPRSASAPVRGAGPVSSASAPALPRSAAARPPRPRPWRARCC